MFLPPKLKTIGFCSLFSALLFSSAVMAQPADFNRRLEAMQQARMRAHQPAQGVVLASNDETDFVSPPMPEPQARVALVGPETTTSRPPRTLLNQGRVGTGIPNRFHEAASQYESQPLRTARLIDESVVDPGSPIVDSVVVPGGEIIEGDCTTCGEVGGYFDDCCGRGGCPPGPCWLNGLGGILKNGQYFGGATAFRSALFQTPGVTAPQLTEDPSHGFYQGFNFSGPLCRLTCGLLSGQFGMRATQTNFKGSANTTDTRNQIFLTAGLFRRVDYGLQAGVVVDYLRDDWFETKSEVSQLRGDMGWVYPSGKTFGFRFATNLETSLSSGVYGGNPFNNMLTTTNSNYRFYYRCEPEMGGFWDSYLGWSDSQQTVMGLDFDYPLKERAAVQAGFAYYLNNDSVPANLNYNGGNLGEAYNFYVGLVLRPRGRSFYRSYDRPLFDVADNGTMLIERRP